MTKETEAKGDVYWEWFYSSRMRVKRRVLRMERHTARRLMHLMITSQPLIDQRFASDLEWLLTWKLKTGCCPKRMWCDGVEFEKIELVGKRTIRFEGLAWIAPESSDDLFQVPIRSEMTLKPSGKAFKKYCFRIAYNDSRIQAKRT